MGSSGQTVFNNDAANNVSTTGTQTLTNKSLVDASTSFVDDGDNTKKMQFQVSGVSTATTRTLTVPNANVTLNLGTDINSGAATNGQLLTANGTGGSTWTTPTGTLDSPVDFLNYSLTNSVAANALTINLKDKAGNDPSAGSPVTISFRNATSATGTYSQVSATAATSITISSSATLGHTSAVNQYIYLCAINNSGTLELAVIGSRFDLDEGSVVTTTTMSGSATSFNTMYSTTGRSNVAFRVIARLKVNETTAGTWTSTASEISLGSLYQWPESTSISADNAIVTMNNLGTTANVALYKRRERENLVVRGTFNAGTTAGSNFSFSLASGNTIDTNKIPTNSSGTIVGIMYSTNNSAISYGAGVVLLFFDGSDTASIYGAKAAGTTTFTKTTGSGSVNSSALVTFDFSIPIKEWRSF